MPNKDNSKPIYVLVVVTHLNRGGLENRLMDILRNIDYKRVHIDIFTCRQDKGYFDDEASTLGSKIYYNKPLTVSNMFGYVNYFADFLKQNPQYQVVHAHMDAWCSVFCKGAKKAGVKVRIAHSRTAIEKILSLSDLAKDIIRLPIPRYATHMFAVSERAGKWLFGRKNMQTGKVEVWPNAIDSKKFEYNKELREKVRQDLNVGAKHVIMHVGNFTLPKNQIFLVEIAQELKEKSKDFVVLFIGDGNHEEHQNLAEKYGLSDYIRFLGARSDIPELLQSADVFVFPSIFEGLPGAVIEAQAAGVPCVISDVISKEVCVTPLVTMNSLQEPVSNWTESILKVWNDEHINTSNNFKEKNYDIESLVDKLTAFYESCV